MTALADAPPRTHAKPGSGLATVLWVVAGLVVALASLIMPTAGLLLGLLTLGALVLTRGRGAAGLFSGAAVVLLYVAQRHWGGPALSCNASGSACRELLDPTPVGVIALAVGLLLLVVSRRRAQSRG